MALLFMEGFDDYADNDTDITNSGLWTNISFGSINILSPGRFGGRYLRAYYYSNLATALFADSNSTFYIGFAINPQGTNLGTAKDILQFRYDTTVQFSLYWNTNNVLEVRRSTSTVLGTTTATVSSSTWHYVVLKVFLNDTTGTVELWLDGIKELDLTSQDTLVAGTASVNNVIFSGTNNGSNYNYFDDVYMGDTSGSDMTDQQGDCAIEQVLPDVDGTTNNWTRLSGTANYEMVDDAVPDDDTTYVYSSTATDKELYGCGSLTGDYSTIHAVQVKTKHRKEDAGYRTINNICRSGATESDGALTGVATDYTFKADIFENDPNGGINWTESAVNAMEIGFEIAS